MNMGRKNGNNLSPKMANSGSKIGPIRRVGQQGWHFEVWGKYTRIDIIPRPKAVRMANL